MHTIMVCVISLDLGLIISVELKMSVFEIS